VQRGRRYHYVEEDAGAAGTSLLDVHGDGDAGGYEDEEGLEGVDGQFGLAEATKSDEHFGFGFWVREVSVNWGIRLIIVRVRKRSVAGYER
jgi:hypothetical protein